MPIIKIDWIEGRDDETKQKIVKDITASMESIGVNKKALHIIFNDVKKENWTYY